MKTFDVAIVGGGVVGASLAFGLRKLGARLAVIDVARDDSPSRRNFGLVWLQAKGFGCPAYIAWTRRSVELWPRLASELAEESGIDVGLAQPGGLHVSLSRDELAMRRRKFEVLFAQPGAERYDVEWLDRNALTERIPDVGPAVEGASFCRHDGQVESGRVLDALHRALVRAGVERISLRVDDIAMRNDVFVVRSADQSIGAERIVLAAGLDNARLAPMIGLRAPVRPVKGQVIVLERMRRWLPLPLETMRQAASGHVVIGDSHQDEDNDVVEGPVLAAIARRALAIFPSLAAARVERAWAARRVMTPDGFPVYARSTVAQGAHAVACHSGVTLAAVHAYELAPALVADEWPTVLAPFDPRRFGDVASPSSFRQMAADGVDPAGIELRQVASWPTTDEAERAVVRERW